MERKNMWRQYTSSQRQELEQLSNRYKKCLNAGKTERECIVLGIEMAKNSGYREIGEWIREGKTLKAGDKVYAECMGKALILFQMGSEPLENGMNILGAHVDSPRLDIKQNPLYEDSQMARRSCSGSF